MFTLAIGEPHLRRDGPALPGRGDAPRRWAPDVRAREVKTTHRTAVRQLRKALAHYPGPRWPGPHARMRAGRDCEQASPSHVQGRVSLVPDRRIGHRLPMLVLVNRAPKPAFKVQRSPGSANLRQMLQVSQLGPEPCPTLADVSLKPAAARQPQPRPRCETTRRSQ